MKIKQKVKLWNEDKYGTCFMWIACEENIVPVASTEQENDYAKNLECLHLGFIFSL